MTNENWAEDLISGDWRRQFREDHGDPGPDDAELDRLDRIEAERDNPCLTDYERNR